MNVTSNPANAANTAAVPSVAFTGFCCLKLTMTWASGSFVWSDAGAAISHG